MVRGCLGVCRRGVAGRGRGVCCRLRTPRRRCGWGQVWSSAFPNTFAGRESAVADFWATRRIACPFLGVLAQPGVGKKVPPLGTRPESAHVVVLPRGMGDAPNRGGFGASGRTSLPDEGAHVSPRSTIAENYTGVVWWVRRVAARNLSQESGYGPARSWRINLAAISNPCAMPRSLPRP